MKKDDLQGLYFWNTSLPESLTRDETIDLLREYKEYGDLEIKEKILKGNYRLIAYFVNKYGKTFINSVSACYPSFEDLCQESVLILDRSIESFDLSYKYSFSTYILNAMKKSFIGLTKRKETKLSLQQEIKFGGRKADEEEVSLEDFIKDEKANFEESVLSRRDFLYVKNQILPLLPKQDRELFVSIALEEKTLEDVALEQGISREFARQSFDRVKARVSKMYFEGISQFDIIAKGTKLSAFQRNRLEKICALKKKFPKDYLEVYVPARLSKTQIEFYNAGFMHYYGQSINDFHVGFRQAFRLFNEIECKIEKMYPSYLKDTGKYIKHKEHKLSVQQKINRHERLLDEYGGKFFLYRYFMPTLGDLEQKIFKRAMLEYKGENQAEIAKELGMKFANFSRLYLQIQKKLENTDFEIVVDMIDRSNRDDLTDKLTFTQDAQARVKERCELVEKYGGKNMLRKYFLPLLSENQKFVFEKLFLNPIYATVSDLAKFSNRSLPSSIAAEKIVIEKLKGFNLQKMIEIRNEAEMFVSSRNGETFDESDLEKLNQLKDIKYRIGIVKKHGGKDFLKEMFLPELKINAEKIIFERYFFENKSLEEIYQEFFGDLEKQKKTNAYLKRDQRWDSIQRNNTSERRVYARGVLNNRILPKLRAFKESFNNFDDVVVDFYAKKGYEKEDDKDYMKIAFGLEEKLKLQQEEMENANEYADLIKRCGGSKVLVRKFMPTLKSYKKQIIFTRIILKNEKTSKVAKDLDESKVAVFSDKNAIIKEMEAFAEKFDASKKNREKTKN